MEKLEIKVTKTSISVSNAYVLNQGEYQVDKCAFNFSNEYDGLVKKAIFIDSTNNFEFEMVILNNECDIPYEILQTSKDFTMKVYGYKVENEELIIRYSPTALKIFLREGSYQGSKEVITPSQFEQYEQALHNGLIAIDDKIEEIDTEVNEKIEEIDNTLNSKIQEVDNKIDEVDDKIVEVDSSITQTNNLNIEVSDKINKKVNITLTKKDNTTKTVSINDGESLQFIWRGTSLGIKTDSDSEYTFVDLQGEQGEQGIQGEPFRIKKTYSSVSQMQADFYNMNVGDYVMIATSVETEDNAKLYVRGESEWLFITDFSGSQGIQGQTGLTPNIQIGSVTSGTTPSVTRTGTNENPILNFVLEKGEQGVQGIQGQTGNGIASVTKTSSDPVTLIDTYTILFTNGTSTTFTVQNGFDGEVQQEDLDEVIEVNNKQQNEIDLLNMLYDIFPKTTGEGTNITLNNTKKARLGLDLSGDLSQETVAGNQLYNVNDIYTTSPFYSINEDDWIEIDCDNTNSSSQKFVNFFTRINNLLETNKKYSIIVELKDVVTTGTISDSTYLIITSNQGESSPTQFQVISRIIINNSGNFYKFLRVTPNSFENVAMSLRSFLAVESGVSVKMKLRISVLEDTSITEDNFVYEKFVGGSPSPNPDYPQEIKVVTGNQNVKIHRKNFFDGIVTHELVSNTGEISNNQTWNLSKNIVVKPNTTYTVSWHDSGQRSILISEWNGTVFIKRAGTQYAAFYSFTTSATTNSIRLNYNNTFGNYDFQIEEGSSATSFEPYQSQTYPINLGVKNLWQNQITGFLSQSGVYPTTDSTYPNARYVLVRLLTGQSITLSGQTGNGRVRYIDKNTNEVVGTITDTENAYFISTGNQSSTLSNGTITAKKEFIVGILDLNGNINDLIVNYGTIPQTISNNPIELAKIGDYKDYIYRENDKWYKYSAINKLIFNGSENWEMYSTNFFHFGLFSKVGKMIPISNYYIGVIATRTMDNFINETINMNSAINLHSEQGRIRIKNSEISSLDDFKTWLSTHNTIVYYIMTEPTITEITDTTLISQLDNLYNANSYDDTTIIFSDGDLPVVMKATSLVSLDSVYQAKE